MRDHLSLYMWFLVFVMGGISCSRSPDWQFFESKQGGFRIEFPGKPEQSKRFNEMMTEVQVFQIERGAAGILQIVYFDVPEKITKDASEQNRDALLKIDCLHPFSGDSKFRPQEPRKLSVGSVTGISIVGVAPKSDSLPEGGWEEDRCFLAGNRLYHLVAIGPDSESGRRDGARFLDSFGLPPR